MSNLKERRREIAAMDMHTAQDELQKLRRNLFDLRLQKERGEVKNNRQFAQTKADIARLMHHMGELNHAARLAAAGTLATADAAEAEEAEPAEEEE